MPKLPDGVRAAPDAESAAARAAGPGTRRCADPERAHVLSRPWAWPHVRVHGAMLARAVRTRDPREAAGQPVRLAVTAPGSTTGRHPVGNTGRANVSTTAPMPTPPDLADLLAAAVGPARPRPR
ncbi:DUF3703 domain-containing protein (plasmid) [Embleya sp. NBC_00888]|uniref:DUF3703 domain-containing protein n=1 Tax=Embleya sp. NBC_00888 TaxID=2975960 RepID=UPI002F90CFF6|nr:DUF3703 domain-containing protein [Embleya sp. NBC_00888]